MAAITVPSLRSLLNTVLAASALPPPDLFWTTIRGLPGMYLCRTGAMSRVVRSVVPPGP